MTELNQHNPSLSDPNERLAFTVVEASRALGVSEYKLRTMFKSGELPFAKLNGRTLIRKVDLENLLERSLIRGRS